MTKSFHPDSDSSSNSSCAEMRDDDHSDTYRQSNMEDDEIEDENDHARTSMLSTAGSGILFLYKCSQCEFTSDATGTTQSHIRDFHAGQSNAHMTVVRNL
jgi:uncharacterized Fe-S cluster-containing MiaB family protein